MVTKTPRKKSSKQAMAESIGMTIAPEPVEEDVKSDVKRDAPEPTEARRKEVNKWCDEIRADKKHHNPVFKRMREDMEYARLGASKAWVSADNYTVPLINRHVNQEVASLYAKNPKAAAKRKKRLMYKLWDGTEETAKAALEMFQTSLGQDEMSAAIISEIQEVQAYNRMTDRMAKTLELMFEHYTGESFPDFKKQMKQTVRRTKTCGVGYLELNYHRAMELDPDITKRIGDYSQKLAVIQSRLADLQDKELKEDDAEVDELKGMIDDLRRQEGVLIEEGLMFDFPRSTEIIPHRACTLLQGFIGADYITREFHLTPDEIQELYKIDIRKGFKQYYERKGNAPTLGDSGDEARYTGKTKGDNAEDAMACVWRVYNKKTRQVFTLCEGYGDYLKEPAEPEYEIQGFWNIFALVFNPVEDEREIFPPSDVHYLKHPQREFNNARQGLREHRVANRPKYFIRAGAMEEKDFEKIEKAPPHAVIPLKSLETNMKVEDLIQPYKGAVIDPNLYETASIIKDILYGVGTQNANLGPTSGATATESSIAEQSRSTTLSSNVDDLDEFLSEVARAAGQIMLCEVDPETVIEIVGPGAVWPQLDRATIAKEIFLEIKAGSSGRPNKAAELANMERGMPFIIQLGGVSGPGLNKRYMDLLDIDGEDILIDSMPSIITINAIAAAQAKAAFAQQNQQAKTEGEAKVAQQQPGTGNPATDPSQQGGAGADNATKPPGTAPGAQPEYTPPTRRYNAQGARVQ